jgi:hypothetical protein
MVDDAPPALLCLIEGESSLFRVTPTTDIDIIALKDLIKEKLKNSMLSDVDAITLTLWKVGMTMGQR